MRIGGKRSHVFFCFCTEERLSYDVIVECEKIHYADERKSFYHSNPSNTKVIDLANDSETFGRLVLW